jgi:hypothetical protein
VLASGKLIDQMERAGFTPWLRLKSLQPFAASAHSVRMGRAASPFVGKIVETVEVLRPHHLTCLSVAITRIGQLAPWRAVELLEHGIRRLFGQPTPRSRNEAEGVYRESAGARPRK